MSKAAVQGRTDRKEDMKLAHAACRKAGNEYLNHTRQLDKNHPAYLRVEDAAFKRYQRQICAIAQRYKLSPQDMRSLSRL